jgi:hypothetical protein
MPALTRRLGLAEFATAVFAFLAVVLWAAPAVHASFALEAPGGSLSTPAGVPLLQAGAHPDVTTNIPFKTTTIGGAGKGPDGNVRDIRDTLPPGLIGDPQPFARCGDAQLKGPSGFAPECPVGAQVGVAEITNCNTFFVEEQVHSFCSPTVVALYNMQPPDGTPAQFGLNVDSVLVYLDFSLRHREGVYRLVTETSKISQTLALDNIKITFWGVPADPVHDSQRVFTRGPNIGQSGAEASGPEVPLTRSPTSCGSPLSFSIEADSWDGVTSTGNYDTQEGSSTPIELAGCVLVPFAPAITVVPTSTQAGAPTGLEVDLRLAQNENPRGLGSSDLRSAVVTLPEGMVVNPSAADGLGACGAAEVGLEDEGIDRCPESSKLGSVKITTPLLDTPLEGSVYLARQNENPFGSTLAIYIVASGSGVIVKLAGLIAPDQQTGQLVAKFEDLPQLEFSEMALRFKGGERAPLTNPSSCGIKTATASLGSWSGRTVSSSSNFAIDGSCATGGFAPAFSAGSTSSQAGADTGFTLAFSRSDGEQVLGAISVQTPPGLLGYLKNVPLCPEVTATAGMCGPQSLIGHTTVAAGAGSNPFYLTGNVYLTGPYDGAPFGLAIVVPAKAGPLDLGLVVVRASINVSRTDAHLTITSSPLPSILQGIPLQLRSVSVTVDRANFMINPTSCQPQRVSASISGAPGTTRSVFSVFQATNCRALRFAPRLTALTRGDGRTKGHGASLHVQLISGVGQANIKSVSVALPEVLSTRLTTIQKACTDSQFAKDPAGCPEASDIGTAVASTPILAQPLTGPVYLVSHGGAAFPDIVVLLQGEGIRIDLTGNIAIKKGVTTSTFATVPDAPISRFDLDLPEGLHSALAAVGNLCAGKLAMPTTITAQDGAVLTPDTPVNVSGCAGKLSVRSLAIVARSLRLTLVVPGAGKLMATARGLKAPSRTVKGRQLLDLRLTATRRGAFTTKINLTFSPTEGKREVKILTVTFKREPRHRGTLQRDVRNAPDGA